MSLNAMRKTLENHPRLVGALFTASLLVMNVGNILAGSGGGTSGP